MRRVVVEAAGLRRLRARFVAALHLAFEQPEPRRLDGRVEDALDPVGEIGRRQLAAHALERRIGREVDALPDLAQIRLAAVLDRRAAPRARAERASPAARGSRSRASRRRCSPMMPSDAASDANAGSNVVSAIENATRSVFAGSAACTDVGAIDASAHNASSAAQCATKAGQCRDLIANDPAERSTAHRSIDVSMANARRSERRPTRARAGATVDSPSRVAARERAVDRSKGAPVSARRSSPSPAACSTR